MTNVERLQAKHADELKRAQSKDAAVSSVNAIATKFDPTILSVGSFRGHPVIQFGTDADGRPFSFGQNKAERILLAVDQYGLDAVMDAIRAIAGRKQ